MDRKKKDEAPLSIGVLSMDEHGELKILEAPKENKKELMVLDDNANAGLIQAIEKDYMDLNEDGNEYVMSLVARTFCPLASTMESVVDIEKEVANYNSYLEFYKRSKDEFIKTVNRWWKNHGVMGFLRAVSEKLQGNETFSGGIECEQRYAGKEQQHSATF